jgi:hypothetical protein
MPPIDWPPGARRLSKPLAGDRDRQAAAVHAIFGATPAETTLLLTLMRCGSLAKPRFRNAGSVCVQIYALRKRLAPFGIQIISMWGHG